MKKGEQKMIESTQSEPKREKIDIGGLEFELVTPPDTGPICDFCSSEDVCWLYPTEKTMAYAGMVGDKWILGESLPGFVACDACSALIEAGKRKELEARSIEALPAEAKDFDPELIRCFMAGVHKAFWEHRCGPRQPFGGRA